AAVPALGEMRVDPHQCLLVLHVSVEVRGEELIGDMFAVSGHVLRHHWPIRRRAAAGSCALIATMLTAGLPQKFPRTWILPQQLTQPSTSSVDPGLHGPQGGTGQVGDLL